MQSNSGNPFGDKKLIFSVLIVIVFMVGWQYFLEWKYPHRNKPKIAPTDTAAPASPTVGAYNPKTDTTNAAPTELKKDASGAATPKAEQTLSFENDNVKFTVSTAGMGIKEFFLKKYKTHQGEPIRISAIEGQTLFALRSNDLTHAIDFDVKEVSPGVFEGQATSEGMQIRRTLEYQAGNGSFANTVTVKSVGEAKPLPIKMSVSDVIRAPVSSSWLFPSYEHQDFFVGHAGTTDSINYSRAKEDVKKDYENGLFVALGDQYFTTALMDESDVAPKVTAQASIAHKQAEAVIAYQPAAAQTEASYKQIIYVGPKSYDALERINPKMTAVIDFGMLGFIAKPLLWCMKAFYGMVGNWGLAIILLTLLVRFIVLPFNLMSARSMRAMQKIQPLIKDLKEKYKDDPMAQQKEMMALMKQNNANPIGGCLPMLLQIPVFFALFRVIGSSVDLYQSPFALWIHDLSQHDPYYVLPVLMGITMYIQSKLTPTAMDPAQAKIMAFMPVIFSVFMLQLPAGLTLYMFVSAVFGIVQQWFILRENKALVPSAKTT